VEPLNRLRPREQAENFPRADIEAERERVRTFHGNIAKKSREGGALEIWLTEGTAERDGVTCDERKADCHQNFVDGTRSKALRGSSALQSKERRRWHLKYGMDGSKNIADMASPKCREFTLTPKCRKFTLRLLTGLNYIVIEDNIYTT
jgi:hypothetical protein